MQLRQRTTADGVVDHPSYLRVQVVVQEERQGWAGNVNFLLDQVTTPYAFLYFHDDVIMPQYVERLVAVADARPDAASVHCTVGRYGEEGDAASVAVPFDVW